MVYSVQMSKKIDSHIASKYKIGELLGSGAYGHVWKVEDRVSHRRYALKKVFGAFRNNIDAQRTYRQVQILQKISHNNIIKLHKVLGSDNKEDLYLVFEFMEADLLAVIGSTILNHNHQKYVLFQIVKGIHHLHQLQLLHRDLKPSNVLIDSDCNAKLCDFGLVRSLAVQEEEQHPILSEEVATRWYRAPELLLGSRTYSYPADIWSIGCIAAELLTGKPIFEGKSVLEQLEKIIQFTGDISPEDLESLDSPVVECLVSQIKPKFKLFSEYFSMIDPQFFPLLRGMLKFNPGKRLTALDALNLDIFKDFSSEMNSNFSIEAISPQLDDNKRYNVREYRREIYSVIPKQLRAASDKKENHENGGYRKECHENRGYRKETVKSLPSRKKVSKTVEVVHKVEIVPPKKRTYSKPVQKKFERRRFSSGVISAHKKDQVSIYQTPLSKSSHSHSSPYLSEIKAKTVSKVLSKPHLNRFERQFPQIKKLKKQPKLKRF